MGKTIVCIRIISSLVVVFSACKEKPAEPVYDNPFDIDNSRPTASFIINPASGTTHTNFNFDASESSDNEDLSSILEVRWDWENDGLWDTGYSTIKSASHQYAATGIMTIKLGIRDTGNMTDSTTKQLTVLVNTAPTASFTVNPAYGTTGTVFNFDASASSDNEDALADLQVRWDWENDGAWDTGFATMKAENHQYGSENIFLVGLEVRDPGGLTNIATRQVEVSNATTGSVTDIDGNVYSTVKIGDQWWMAENLKVTRYRNSDQIPNIINDSQWPDLTTGAYSAYNNDDGSIADYGLLYNGYAASDSRNIAPLGWHVPTDDEWKQLEIFLGMSQSDADEIFWRGTDQGAKIKETGTDHWAFPNSSATNSTGFSARGAGYRAGDLGDFRALTAEAYFWSNATGTNAWHRLLAAGNSNINRYNSLKVNGFSIRCVRD
jgi:uncharacterized protein (TIGR02145 family)